MLLLLIQQLLQLTQVCTVWGEGGGACGTVTKSTMQPIAGASFSWLTRVQLVCQVAALHSLECHEMRHLCPTHTCAPRAQEDCLTVHACAIH